MQTKNVFNFDLDPSVISDSVKKVTTVMSDVLTTSHVIASAYNGINNFKERILSFNPDKVVSFLDNVIPDDFKDKIQEKLTSFDIDFEHVELDKALSLLTEVSGIIGGTET